MQDEVDNTAAIAFRPSRRDLHLFSAFLQDEITLLKDQLILTIGSKFEHNDFSGFEFQPSARIAWLPAASHTVWAAVSRAVRSPSRIDTEVFAPSAPPFVLRGGGDRFDSETVIAYELGYRTELANRLGLSISTFFNDYDDLRSVEPIAGAPGQFIILNGLRAKTYGVELSIAWQALDWWWLRGGYTYFRKKIRHWEFAIVGQNLLDKRHPEFGAPATRQEIPRSVYGKVTWKFWTGGNEAKVQ